MIFICKKLSDGKCIGGKGRVTSVKIDTFQSFYGLAIKSNKGNSEAMSKATLVILYHYMKQANHEYCPKGVNSWCSFNRDKATGNNTPKPVKDPFQKLSNL